MPRLVHAQPKYRKHRASGQAVVTIDGVDCYLGPHNSKASRRQYDRLIGEWLQGGRSLHPTGGAPITIVELCARYWKFAKAYYQRDGRSTKATPGIKCALRYVKTWYGKDAVEDFGPLALKAIRQRMVDDGLGRKYVNSHVGRIKRMFKWAAGEELVSADIYNALALVAGLKKGRTSAHETPPVLPVAESTLNATLPHLPQVVADMVQLQRLTGMRPNEVCILRPCDLDRSADVWTYRPESHKTEHHGRERVIVVGPRAQEILLRYLARDAEAFCFRPCDSEEKRRAEQHAARKTPLSCGNKPGSNRKRRPKRSAGEVYETASYRRAIHRACDKAFPHPQLSAVKQASLSNADLAKLKEWQSKHRWSPNQLRHAAATSIRKEFDLEAAQVVLGHAQANVTQIYAERDLAKAAEVARKLG